VKLSALTPESCERERQDDYSYRCLASLHAPPLLTVDSPNLSLHIGAFNGRRCPVCQLARCSPALSSFARSSSASSALGSKALKSGSAARSSSPKSFSKSGVVL
jgi:hypothetical protein